VLALVAIAVVYFGGHLIAAIAAGRIPLHGGVP